MATACDVQDTRIVKIFDMVYILLTQKMKIHSMIRQERNNATAMKGFQGVGGLPSSSASIAPTSGFKVNACPARTVMRGIV